MCRIPVADDDLMQVGVRKLLLESAGHQVSVALDPPETIRHIHTILNRSTLVYDLVRSIVHRATDDEPLVVPEGAVVIAGSRAVTSAPGKDWGISVYTPVIVQYRDAKQTREFSTRIY